MTGYEQSPEYGGPEPSFWKETRSGLTSIVGIGLFCWAAFGLLSLLSDLAFVIAAVDWSIGHVSISFKDIILGFGKWISDAVSGYREFVRGVARLLHVPSLPPVVYDVLGVIAFSLGRGYLLGRRALKETAELFATLFATDEEHANKAPAVAIDGFAPLRNVAELLLRYIGIAGLHLPTVVFAPDKVKWTRSTWWRVKFAMPAIWTLVYGTAVSLVLGLLFGIDYVYRHFAL
jgi:hypothetical protein